MSNVIDLSNIQNENKQANLIKHSDGASLESLAGNKESYLDKFKKQAVFVLYSIPDRPTPALLMSMMSHLNSYLISEFFGSAGVFNGKSAGMAHILVPTLLSFPYSIASISAANHYFNLYELKAMDNIDSLPKNKSESLIMSYLTCLLASILVYAMMASENDAAKYLTPLFMGVCSPVIFMSSKMVLSKLYDPCKNLTDGLKYDMSSLISSRRFEADNKKKIKESKNNDKSSDKSSDGRIDLNDLFGPLTNAANPAPTLNNSELEIVQIALNKKGISDYNSNLEEEEEKEEIRPYSVSPVRDVSQNLDKKLDKKLDGLRGKLLDEQVSHDLVHGII